MNKNSVYLIAEVILISIYGFNNVLLKAKTLVN